MKAINRPLSPLAALSCKIVGAILIVSFLLDCVVLLIDATFLDKTWQMAFTTQIVDRGVIPLVGLAFLFAGVWIEQNANGSSSTRKPLQDIRFWALLFSSFLGLLFLLLTFVHLINVNAASTQELQQINERATQLEANLNTSIEQRRGLITGLLQNETEYNQQLSQLQQAINSGQVQGDQLSQLQQIEDQLKQFKQNPEAVEQQAQQTKNERLQEIRQEKQQAEKVTQSKYLKSGLQTSLGSFVLSIGYSIIGWTGLRRLGSLGLGSRKSSAR